MIYLELTTSVFNDQFRSQANGSGRAGTPRVRRPLRGLEIKEDTYAFMKIVRADGSEIPLVDSSSPDGTSSRYSNFILQNVSEQRMEKHQVVETFGEPYLYLFGESPRFLDVQAILVDSSDFNWYAEFWENYEKDFRATRSVELGARTYLFYDDNVVEGYVLMAQAAKGADTPLMATLSFRMFVTNYQNVSFVGDPNYPIRSSVNIPSISEFAGSNYDTQYGIEALGPSISAYREEARQLQAAQGARQQNAGFGGAQKLSDVLRQGTMATGDIYTDGVLANAYDALKTVGDRTTELRGKIIDNYDEYTALLPATPDAPDAGQTTPTTGGDDFNLHNGAVDLANQFGADIDDPGIFASLGLMPVFNAASGGIGIGAGLGVSASFGASVFGSIGASIGGGVNGGLGFAGGIATSGGFSALAVAGTDAGGAFVATDVGGGYNVDPGAPLQTLYGPAYTDPTDPFNPGNPYVGNPYAPGVFNNGISISAGISAGVGIGGGVGGSAGFAPYQGGGIFTAPQSAGGYANGFGTSGASFLIGGAPSAFGTVAVPGTLAPAGYAEASVFLGPHGIETDTYADGIFGP